MTFHNRKSFACMTCPNSIVSVAVYTWEIFGTISTFSMPFLTQFNAFETRSTIVAVLSPLSCALRLAQI